MASTATIDQQTLLEVTWAAFQAQIAAGNEFLVLPDNLPSSLVSTITARYSDLINGPVSAVAVPSLKIIRITRFAGSTSSTTSPTASPSAASPASMSETAEPKGKEKPPPRPANAFILYRKFHHARIKSQDPDIPNNDISKKVGAMWHIETEAVKGYWRLKSAQAKEEHMRLYPDYSYQPRKPSEKKRRMTKRKAAAIQAQTFGSAPIAGDQMGMSAQVALPAFTFSSDDSANMSFNVYQDATGVQDFGQLVDYHNNSQAVYDHNAALAAAPVTTFEFDGAFYPATDLQNFTSGLEFENADIPGEPFVYEEAVRTAEQARQARITEDVLDFDAFLADYPQEN